MKNKLINFKKDTLYFENNIWKYIEKNKNIIFFIIITLMALAIRIPFFDFENGDYTNCLLVWYKTLANNGGLKALSMSIGDYNAPYLTILAIMTYIPIKVLYLIKSLSLIFDFICAIFVMKIINKLNNNKTFLNYQSIISYSIILFLPTVILNSSCWSQADAIYTGFVLISLYLLLKDKYFLSFIFLGIAFSFKLQFIFILPLYILYYMKERKFSYLYFFIIPIVDLIMCIPSMIMGKPLIDCIMIYVNQSGSYSSFLSMNMPNVYTLLFNDVDSLVYTSEVFFSKIGVLFTIFIYIIMAFIILSKNFKFNKQNIIDLSLISILIAVFFLPHMHDRYLYMADIISIIYLFNHKDRFYIPICINLISLYTYMFALFKIMIIPMVYVSILYLIILILVCYFFYKDNITKKNKQ